MKYIASILSCCLFTAVYGQKNVNISGSCPLIKDGSVISISRIPSGREPEKKIIVNTHNHYFGFQVPAENGEAYFLQFNNRGTRFYFEPGQADIFIADSVGKSISVKGNPVAVAFDSLENKVRYSSEKKGYDQARISYFTYLQRGNINDSTKRQLKRIVDSASLAFNKFNARMTLDYINDHSRSSLNTFLLYNIMDQLSEDSITRIFETFPIAAKGNRFGKELKYRIDSLFIGGKAPAFSQADTAGLKVRLSDFRGRYVLVDFWASWCAPCRADNPNVIKAYNKYSGKKFSILSVSLDTDKNKWLNAIHHDKMPWTHVSDLKEFSNEISVKYYVLAVPNNFLIDPNGVIVAKDIHGEELLGKLKSIFNY